MNPKTTNLLLMSAILFFASCAESVPQRGIKWDASAALPSVAGQEVNEGVAGAFAGMLDGRLLVAGGANFPDGYPWEGGAKKWYDILYTLDTGTGEWTVAEGFLPRPLAYGASVQAGDRLVWIGGCDDTQCYPDVWTVRSDGNGFSIHSDLPPLPIPLANHSAVACGNRLYVCGGQETMSGEASTDHFIMLDLDEPGKGWTALGSWPGPSLGFALTASSGRYVYLFGGGSYGPDIEKVKRKEGYRYDTEAGSWETLEGEFPFMAGTVLVDHEMVFFLGGVEEILPTTPDHPGFSRVVAGYDPRTGRLSEFAVCPYPIPVTTAVVQDRSDFYVTSGELRPGVRTPVILKGSFLR